MDSIIIITSIMLLNVDGADRIGYTFDKVDPETGTIITQNSHGNFVVVDENLRSDINEIRSYILKNGKFNG